MITGCGRWHFSFGMGDREGSLCKRWNTVPFGGKFGLPGYRRDRIDLCQRISRHLSNFCLSEASVEPFDRTVSKVGRRCSSSTSGGTIAAAAS